MENHNNYQIEDANRRTIAQLSYELIKNGYNEPWLWICLIAYDIEPRSLPEVQVSHADIHLITLQQLLNELGDSA